MPSQPSKNTCQVWACARWTVQRSMLAHALPVRDSRAWSLLLQPPPQQLPRARAPASIHVKVTAALCACPWLAHLDELGLQVLRGQRAHVLVHDLQRSAALGCWLCACRAVTVTRCSCRGGGASTLGTRFCALSPPWAAASRVCCARRHGGAPCRASSRGRSGRPCAPRPSSR